MHPLLEIEGCKCTRCTRAAAVPAYAHLLTLSMNWLSFLGGVFYGQFARISKKTYLEPANNASSPYDPPKKHELLGGGIDESNCCLQGLPVSC